MYVINKTDGSIAATVNDGVVDTSYTDLYLVGRNYLAYGALINDNFVRLLENFANDAAPTKPLKGQIWWSKNDGKLLVHDGVHFKSINAVTVNSAAPDHPQEADFWYDSANQQLKFYANESWAIISPLYSSAQGLSGFVVQDVTDVGNDIYTVTKLYNGGHIVAIVSDFNFTPSPEIPGFTDIYTGINIVASGVLNGTAANADMLNNLTSDSYMRADANTGTTGMMTVANDGGIEIGVNGDLAFGIDENGVNIVSPNQGQGLNIWVRTAANSNVAAMMIDQDSNITVANDITANNVYSVNNIEGQVDLVIQGNASINGSDSYYDGNLEVNQNLVVGSDVAISGNLTAMALLVDSIAAPGLSADVLTINTPDMVASPIVAINGNVIIQNLDTVTDAYLGFDADTETAAIGFDDNSDLAISRNGNAIVTFGYNSATFDADVTMNGTVDVGVLSTGSMSMSDGIIATTLSNADITILANGDGSVIVSDLYTDGIVETALLNVSATNQSVTVDTGAAVIAGGLGVGRTVNIGGDLHVGGVIYGTTSVSAIPAGAVMHFAMVTPPVGWMICNGAQVSRAIYADLFAAIGTTFGAGNGTTTFNLPDLRGEFIRGYDSSRGLDTGRTFGSSQADGIKSHSHEWYLGQSAGTLADRKIGGWNFTGTYKASAYGTNTFVGTTGITETRPVNVALQPCIKY